MSINIKEVHDRARRGDHINDDELKALIEHFRQLLKLMDDLAWVPATWSTKALSSV